MKNRVSFLSTYMQKQVTVFLIDLDDDFLMNLCIEKMDQKLTGHIRIRS